MMNIARNWVLQRQESPRGLARDVRGDVQAAFRRSFRRYGCKSPLREYPATERQAPAGEETMPEKDGLLVKEFPTRDPHCKQVEGLLEEAGCRPGSNRMRFSWITFLL